MWATQGYLRAPVETGTILADTGAMVAGLATVTILITHIGGSGSLLLVQRSALDAAKNTHTVSLAGLPPAFSFPITLALGERLQVLAATDLDSDVQVSLIT